MYFPPKSGVLTLQLQAEIAPGVALAVGCRNSVDKSLPIGFCCGQRVFVCDSLAFSSDVVITRKHTRFGQARFGEAIAATVAGLEEFRANEARRIELYRTTELAPDQANSLILQAYERGIIGGAFTTGCDPAVAKPIPSRVPREDGMEPPERLHGSFERSSAAAARPGRPRDDQPPKTARRHLRHRRPSGVSAARRAIIDPVPFPIPMGAAPRPLRHTEGAFFFQCEGNVTPTIAEELQKTPWLLLSKEFASTYS